MNKEVVDAIVSRLDALATKLGQTTETILGWAARRVYAVMVVDIIVEILLIALTVGLYIFVTKKEFKSSDLEDGCVIVNISLFVATIFWTFITIASIRNFASIEFSALEKVIDLLK